MDHSIGVFPFSNKPVQFKTLTFLEVPTRFELV